MIRRARLFQTVGVTSSLSSLMRSSTTTTATTAGAPVAAAPAAAAPAAAATAPAAAAVKAPKKASSFDKVLGEGRKWESHPAGEHITVYVDCNYFAWIVMDRAGSSANALGESFVASLSAALDITDKLVAANKAQVAVIASAKETFCVGADLEQMYPVTDKNIAEQASKGGQAIFNRIESSKYPVVAAINGLALGGGCELALACHHRLMSDKAAMGLPECLLGLLPGAGGTVRLQKLIGLSNALTWILTSGSNKADKCKRQGAVDAVIPGGDRWKGEGRFFEGVRSWIGLKLVGKPLKPAKRKNITLMDKFLERTPIGRGIVAKKSLTTLNEKTKGKYIGQYKALESVMFALQNPADKAYDKEAKLFAELLVTPEAKNQCSLYFLDDSMKKLEKKTGMAKDKIPVLKNTGVIGAGVMGSGIVHYFANKNYPVAVKDLKQEVVDKGIAMVEAEFGLAVKKKKLDEAGLKKKMSLIKGGTTDDIFKDCDVIVEAAVEVMSIKKKLVESLESSGVLDGKKLFATNTSSLSLTELQTVSKYPENIVGMHFFNPVAKMPLVEVIVGKKTSKEAAAAIFALALKTGKKPIIVGDAPGFLVNRILGVYMAEAGRLAIQDKADVAKIDATMLDFGMPMGPFRLLDEVGLDVACHVGPVLENGLKSKRFAVDSRMNKLVDDGLLGKKNNRGFYNYENGKDKGLNTDIVKKYINDGPSANISSSDILDRCVLLMVNEASYILAEGIAASAEDVDIGMIWGTGFPPFRGGLLQYADHRGIQKIVDRLTQLKDTLKDDRFEASPMLKEMAKGNKRFFPNRPFVPYVERSGFPKVQL